MIPGEILDIQARLCQAMGHPSRLKTVHSLRVGEKSVSELAELTGSTRGTVSRQLGILRGVGIPLRRAQRDY